MSSIDQVTPVNMTPNTCTFDPCLAPSFREQLQSILQCHILKGFLPSAQLETRMYLALEKDVPPVSVSVQGDMVDLQVRGLCCHGVKSLDCLHC